MAFMDRINVPTTGFPKRSSLVRKWSSRGAAAPINGGSQNEMWFEATITPP